MYEEKGDQCGGDGENDTRPLLVLTVASMSLMLALKPTLAPSSGLREEYLNLNCSGKFEEPKSHNYGLSFSWPMSCTWTGLSCAPSVREAVSELDRNL